ncbi:MAG: DUF1631 family protein [Bdellovibrionales bacterium]|nr:DUF1631 family protein [Massilia sp.]
MSSFSALAEQTVVEADTQATRAMGLASPLEVGNLNAIRSFLRGEGRTLRTRMDRHFAGLLERAMQTMHVDLRQAPADINYATLTLVDDDVVVRQIELDRMVARLRDAEPVALGRVNITIAMLHNDHDVRERENPFRPYLLARSLYEALRELMWDESQSKMLFDALGQAMTRRLPGFYAGILDVFESAGVTARLTARPSAMSRAEKERIAWQSAARQLLLGDAESVTLSALHAGSIARPAVPAVQVSHAGIGAPMDKQNQLPWRLLPELQRLRNLHKARGDGGLATREQDLIDVVWNIFHQPAGAKVAREFKAPAQFQSPPMKGERGDLDTALFSLQQDIAAGAEPPAPLALRDLVADTGADREQWFTMEVVALLFESIIADDLVDGVVQQQLARLFVPFTRAALVDPDLLHNARHPARGLIDRLGSISAGIPPGHPVRAALEQELGAIVGAVLDLFDDDVHIFADAENALDAHVSDFLAAHDARIAPCIAAVAEAASASSRLAAAGSALSGALQPLHVDPRLADFILGTWARVMSHPGGEQAAVALLPELLWSSQAKSTPEDRSAMMRMLPELVRQVREGMAAISLPEAPSKAAFDRLVAVHMDVLANKQTPSRKNMTLEQFRHHFKDVAIDPNALAIGGKDGWVGKFELEAALARRAVSVTLNARSAARLPHASDADWMSWARPGAAFEIKIDDRYKDALLCAVSPGSNAYLFSVEGQAAQALYLRGPLLEALENAIMRPAEHAPLFDRGVQSLVAGAESLPG